MIMRGVAVFRLRSRRCVAPAVEKSGVSLYGVANGAGNRELLYVETVRA